MTPIESKLEKQQEEAQTKCWFDQGEGSGIIGLSNEKTNKIIDTITSVVNEN